MRHYERITKKKNVMSAAELIDENKQWNKRTASSFACLRLEQTVIAAEVGLSQNVFRCI